MGGSSRNRGRSSDSAKAREPSQGATPSPAPPCGSVGLRWGQVPWLLPQVPGSEAPPPGAERPWFRTALSIVRDPVPPPAPPKWHLPLHGSGSLPPS